MCKNIRHPLKLCIIAVFRTGGVPSEGDAIKKTYVTLNPLINKELFFRVTR